MKLNKLLKASERGDIEPLVLAKSFMRRQDCRDDVARVLRDCAGAEKFIVDLDDIEYSDTEVMKTTADMRELKLFHLPYPVCYLEWEGELRTRTSLQTPNEVVTEGVLVDVPTFCLCMKETPHLEVISVVTFLKLKKDPRRTFRMLEGFLNIRTHPLNSLDPTKATLWDYGFYEYFKVPEHIDLGMQRMFSKIAYVVEAFVVLLNTRGMEHTTERLKGCKLISRDRPEDCVHIVRAARPGGEDRSSANLSGTPITERKRPRLHLRRGHIRQQRWGRDRKRVKQVWIEPQLIGHEEEGRIQHIYEVD